MGKSTKSLQNSAKVWQNMMKDISMQKCAKVCTYVKKCETWCKGSKSMKISQNNENLSKSRQHLCKRMQNYAIVCRSMQHYTKVFKCMLIYAQKWQCVQK